MKPLVRWTIGPCIPEGVRCLGVAVRAWEALYGGFWDYAVCFNGQRPQLPSWVELIDQRDYRKSLPLPPRGPAWKLYPCRLRPSSHEIIIDNDLVLYERHPMVDEFLRGGCTLTTEAYRRSYGMFDAYAPKVSINTGMIGLPPDYDLREKIKGLIQKVNLTSWGTHFCEQGIVACSLESPLVIPRSDIAVGLDAYSPGRCGIHFVGLNSGYSGWWDQFLWGKLL